METLLRVTWTVTQGTTPLVWRHCGRCAQPRPFVCSDKFRLNAQKKLIDVWLIYRCQVCGRRWNLPIFERRPVATIDPQDHAAMMANDAALARHYALDRARLQSHATRIEAGAAITIGKRPDGPVPTAPVGVVISVEAAPGCAIRLDRLVAVGLGLPRGAVRQLEKRGAITATPEGRAAFRRPLRDGQVIEVSLASLDSRPDLIAAILGGARSGARSCKRR